MRWAGTCMPSSWVARCLASGCFWCMHRGDTYSGVRGGNTACCLCGLCTGCQSAAVGACGGRVGRSKKDCKPRLLNDRPGHLHAVLDDYQLSGIQMPLRSFHCSLKYCLIGRPDFFHPMNLKIKSAAMSPRSTNVKPQNTNARMSMASWPVK